MNVKDAADFLKENLTALDVARMYGMEPKPGAGSAIVCPFHGDHDASLHLYPGNRGWHCFGCGAGGTIIDFVMRMDGLAFSTAVHHLDEMAGTRLLDVRKVDLDASRRNAEVARFNAVRDCIVKAWEDVEKLAADKAVTLMRDLHALEDTPLEDRDGKTWDAINSIEEQMRDMDALIFEAHKHRKEVQAWRIRRRESFQETQHSFPVIPCTQPAQKIGSMRSLLYQAQNRITSRG